MNCVILLILVSSFVDTVPVNRPNVSYTAQGRYFSVLFLITSRIVNFLCTLCIVLILSDRHDIGGSGEQTIILEPD